MKKGWAELLDDLSNALHVRELYQGAVDVIAIKKGAHCGKTGGHCPVIRAIQCKPKGYRLTKADREKTREWAEKTGIEVKFA